MTQTDASEGRASTGLRAVVVDDSHFMRTVVSDMLKEEGISVVETASDGKTGVECVIRHEPDVVTMDLEMPRMDGIEAVERIMKAQPTPILVLSAHASDGAELTFEAMDRGAVDFFEKPSGEISVGIKRQQTRLAKTVRSVASVDTPANVHTSARTSGRPKHAALESECLREPTLVIGSSTGGPTVVTELLSELPVEANLRILIVQHMPDGFTARFAERLDQASEYEVREATDGARIGGGEALVAKGGKHLEVSGYGGGRIRVSLTEGEPVHNVRPAADITLQTAADRIDGPVTAAILTGMGSDGAAGAEAISAAGGAVLAQDEETSAVFGMPQRAIETGAVNEIRPREELATGVLDLITTGGRQ